MGETIDLIDKCPGLAKVNGIKFIKDTLLGLENEETLNSQAGKLKGNQSSQNALL